MSDIELFPDDNEFDTTGPPASSVAVQHTSAPQDTISEPAAATRGRRPSRAAIAHTSRHRGTPSPAPSRRQPPSPASSYASALSPAPAAEKWTVAELRQALVSSGVSVPRRSAKADLLALYTSLQTGAPPSFTPPSKAADKASQGRSVPYSRPELTTTPSKTGFRPAGRSKKPSASLGRAPDAASPRPGPGLIPSSDPSPRPWGGPRARE
ncbi:translation initiation factor IF-2-like [Sinocyclocheilus grahami]|uniref:translation initiation factor IF-2-like n=1 Tax=Sinocyclocheilus grahami TaxID=75366 RepID=UPI0007AC91D8|nr:PREDICTED: translation initiation factor IF-2-like [Sinocyclocheilus grahami]